MYGENLPDLPVTSEQLRSFVLPVIIEMQSIDSRQLGLDLYGRIASHACKARVFGDETPDPNARRLFLSRRDTARVEDMFWDLIIEGIIRPGPGGERGGAALPFFHLTEWGEQVATASAATPYDPDKYLTAL